MARSSVLSRFSFDLYRVLRAKILRGNSPLQSSFTVDPFCVRTVFRQLSRALSSGNGGEKVRIKTLGNPRRGGEWDGYSQDESSSRTSARLWDNPAVINTLVKKKKKKCTRTQEYKHLGSLYFGRGSDIAGSSMIILVS